MTPSEVVALVKEKLPHRKISVGTLSNYRSQGLGPAYEKGYRGRIRYKRESVDKWVEEMNR